MAPSSRSARARGPRRHRLSVASRTVAAFVGAYALASTVSTLLALVLPLPREEAVIAGFLVAFAVVPAAVLWVFAAATAWRAWLGLLGPGILLGVAIWILKGLNGAPA